MSDETRFGFGKNWQRFLDTQVTPEREAIAKNSILDFMKTDSLEGKTFIDIGCGSGLFSNAAYELGVSKLISFDYDPFSVACCQHFHERAGKPDHWQVMQGSVLDQDFLNSLGKFDIVYSWGVLHHTGDMWPAIGNALNMVEENGQFYISIYNKVRGWKGSKRWHKIKKTYCNMPRPGQWFMEQSYYLYKLQSKLLRGRWNYAKEYKKKRGMEWKTDLIDWLGGYPYEYASIGEIFQFVTEQRPDFNMTNLSESRHLGTHSFLFQHFPRVVTAEAIIPDNAEANTGQSPPESKDA